jgi:hypothetical protein
MARIRPDTTLADQLETLYSVGAVGSLPDDRLLDIFLARDDPAAAETAFAALVDRHGPMVLSVCQRVLQNPHDAHDAFQATFLVTIDGVIRDRDTGRPVSGARILSCIDSMSTSDAQGRFRIAGEPKKADNRVEVTASSVFPSSHRPAPTGGSGSEDSSPASFMTSMPSRTTRRIIPSASWAPSAKVDGPSSPENPRTGATSR